MTSEEIIEKINTFLVEEFEVEEDTLIPEDNVQEILDLDSLDYVDLVVVIEKNFGFKVSNKDFESIKTLQNFYDYIINKVNP
jgi:acyl carrier protein